MIRLLAVFTQESLFSVLVFNSESEAHDAEAAIRAVAGEAADDLRFSHAEPDALVDVLASFAPEADEYPPCPICGEPIDFCPGHGEPLYDGRDGCIELDIPDDQYTDDWQQPAARPTDTETNR